MYGRNVVNGIDELLPYTFFSDFLAHLRPLPPPPHDDVVIATSSPPLPSSAFSSLPLTTKAAAASLVVPPAAGNEQLDCYSMPTSPPGCTSSYGSPSYGGEPAHAGAAYGSSSSYSVIQRSMSSHSLQQNLNTGVYSCSYQVMSSPSELYDSGTSSLRTVFSAGDLQRSNMVQMHHNHLSESPLSNESCSTTTTTTSTIIEAMSKACKYNPDEKREKIERYRNKRNQRNFNKKIKYICRKTLADSRPRVRGRFAKNEEIERVLALQNLQNQWNIHGSGCGDDDEEAEENWARFLNSFTANLVPQNPSI